MLPYRVDGEGSPLLLVHGFGVSFNLWKELLPRLSPYLRLIIVELPGIGSAPDPGNSYIQSCLAGIEAVRQSLGIERWAVLGYSSGSRIVEAYANAYPQHLTRLAFLCAALVPDLRSHLVQFLLWLDARVNFLGNWALSGWRLYWLVRILGFNGEHVVYTAEWTSEIGAQPIATLRATLNSVPLGGRKPFALPPTVPALFIWGERDFTILRPRRRHANYKFIAADHSAPLRSAAEVANILIPYLTTSHSA